MLFLDVLQTRRVDSCCSWGILYGLFTAAMDMVRWSLWEVAIYTFKGS